MAEMAVTGRRHVGQGRRQGHHRDLTSAACCCSSEHATATAIRSAGAATRRCSTTPSRAGTSARPQQQGRAAREATSRSTGSPSTSATAASATGSRTTSTGRSRRERYWGTPLPFWRCDDGRQTAASARVPSWSSWRAGPRRRLEATGRPRTGRSSTTSPRCAKCGGEARRVPEVADAWFDCGACPSPSGTTRFENEDEFLQHFPADYICEAIDQTRGWFYTLHAEATLLKLRAARGSASRTSSASATSRTRRARRCRSARATSSTRGRCSTRAARTRRAGTCQREPGGVVAPLQPGAGEEGLRRFLLTLWNTLQLLRQLRQYRRRWTRAAARRGRAAPELDRWLLSELERAHAQGDGRARGLRPDGRGAGDRRRSWTTFRTGTCAAAGARFWRGVSDSATTTSRAPTTRSRTALVTLSKLLAPFTPFVAEEIYAEPGAVAGRGGAGERAPRGVAGGGPGGDRRIADRGDAAGRSGCVRSGGRHAPRPRSRSASRSPRWRSRSAAATRASRSRCVATSSSSSKS